MAKTVLDHAPSERELLLSEVTELRRRLESAGRAYGAADLRAAELREALAQRDCELAHLRARRGLWQRVARRLWRDRLWTALTILGALRGLDSQLFKEVPSSG